jgi:hypothetical protein
MIEVNFDDYKYFPALRTRQAELKGLELLNTARKAKILPLFTLGRWPKAVDFSKSAEKVAAVMEGYPYLLDLTSDANHLAEAQQVLRQPENAFSAWRSFAASNANAIPVVQTPAGARTRDISKQAQEIERGSGRLAFRIKEFSTDVPNVIAALSAIDNPKNAIVFVDCQYIRSALPAYITASIATINQLRAEFPELFVAVLSTSFPVSTVKFADQSGLRGSIDIMERELHQQIGGDAIAAYGDHSSIHSIVYDDVPIMRWAARVDYPRPLDWYFERRPQDQSADGYVSAAQAIAALDQEIGKRGIWGEDMIIKAASGNPHAKAPGPWISVRVNIHLSRQIDFAEQMTAGAPDEDDDWLNIGED